MEEEAPVTAATGALGPVIAKLAALLGSEYKLRWRTRWDVKFIRAKLKPVHSLLWNIWEKEELDVPSMALKMEALDLADDVDDAIVDFILSLERSHSNKRLVQTKLQPSPCQDFKKRASDVLGRCRSKWEEKKKKPAADGSSPAGKLRAYPFVRKPVSELVGMFGPRYKLIQHLVGNNPVQLQRRTALIFGTAGMGKTTLADLVYEEIGNKFQLTRAFVSVNPGGNITEVLQGILKQVAPNTSVPPLAGDEAAATEEEHLIDIISNFLKDKRYLVIIDDIWNWRELEAIMKSLPENNLGSAIVGTTRMNVVAKKWNDGPENLRLIFKILPQWHSEEGWVYGIGEENVPTRWIGVKDDLVPEGFDHKHPIVRMCGGMPLAVLCMLSAVAQQREKQAQQGLHAKACDVQAEIEKHVMENGIQNTPGFEPLVESLQLGYDDLPHMLKTCLLYCSIYPEGHFFERDDLVRRWISEGFVYKEREAKGYYEELVNRGLILHVSYGARMHPMTRNFLRWKSRQDNFTTCSSEITPSYNNTYRIRRLCICNSTCKSSDTAADPLSALDWNQIRSLTVYEGIERVPFDKLEGVRVLDLCEVDSLLDHHLKAICGLVRLRHLLGLKGDRISNIPSEIVRLQCLETFGASGRPVPGFIGNLQQLKTLELRGEVITKLPREIGALQQLETLRMHHTYITELPREVWILKQLKTLDMSNTKITVLPKEIRELQCLQTLDISNTPITMLPKEIGELQHLEHLLMFGTKVAKIPREIGTLKELKSLRLDYSLAVVPLEVCALVELPECIHQALNKSGLVSELAREMLSFRKYSYLLDTGGLVVGAKQMRIPPWIKEHFNDLAMLDIRICKLEEQGLKILREIPKLEDLTLRFEVVPRESVVISSKGFAMLKNLTVDSRVPRVTFQEGAMSMLGLLTFKFQFYAGPPNEDPVGINHLGKLYRIEFECNKDWYPGGDSPCIRPTIDIVRKEAQQLRFGVTLQVCGHMERIDSLCETDEEEEEEEEEEERSRTGETEEEEERRSNRMGETEDEETSSGVGEIEEENFQA